MDKRIDCDCCPLNGIGTDELCESNCSDMADYKEEIYNQALEDLIEKIGNYTIVCNDGVTEIVEMKEIIRCKEQLIK